MFVSVSTLADIWKCLHGLSHFLSHIIPGCWGAGGHLGRIISGEGLRFIGPRQAMPTEVFHEHADKDFGELLQSCHHCSPAFSAGVPLQCQRLASPASSSLSRAGMAATTLSWMSELIRKHAPAVERIVFEIGPLSIWFWHALRAEGLPAICVDARHAAKALELLYDASVVILTRSLCRKRLVKVGVKLRVQARGHCLGLQAGRYDACHAEIGRTLRSSCWSDDLIAG